MFSTPPSKKLVNLKLTTLAFWLVFQAKSQSSSVMRVSGSRFFAAVSARHLVGDGKVSVLGIPIDLGGNRRGVDMGPSAFHVAGLNSQVK